MGDQDVSRLGVKILYNLNRVKNVQNRKRNLLAHVQEVFCRYGSLKVEVIMCMGCAAVAEQWAAVMPEAV